MDPEKTKLVDRVKTYQRGSQEQKETWYNFCGEVAGKKTMLKQLGFGTDICDTHTHTYDIIWYYI